ncbi:hypothetical protein [Streptomyces subrutilus]|uniref:hypothetical protein n=1 Tax=Streptomyces subrutilus TaxID=36818 RepID=UPI002E149C0C|nr:DUF4232 domain-containing protein [Streptomyces subrutilus]
MSGNRRKALLVSAALVGGALLMTACQSAGAATDTGAAQGAPAAAPSAPSAAPADAAAAPAGAPATGGNQGSANRAPKGAAKGSDASAKGTGGAGSGADTGAGGRQPVRQSCAASDIAWSTRSESQAGGYVLIIAKAKPGVTCVLPGTFPIVAFGSDGTEAGPAEHSVGEPITLSGNTAAYAGVNPKTTREDGGRELDFLVVAVDGDDPAPVSLPVGALTVDKPVVTNWHTAPKDAVPLG